MRTSPDRCSVPPLIQCDVSWIGDHAMVAVRGDVDRAGAQVLLGALDVAVMMPITVLTVDLEQVSSLGGPGLAALVAGRLRAAHRDITFRLSSMPNQARRLVEASGLAELLGLAP